MYPATPLLVAVTLNPTLADKEAPPTDAEAEIVVAPAAVGLTALIWMVATPEASVRAVPVDGVIAASVGVVAKVTTVFGTTAPAASRTVAVTRAGLPVLILETAVPVKGLVKAMLIPVAPVLVAFTPKPVLTERLAPPTVAVADTVVAPAAVGLAPMIWIAATPEASVRADPEAGIMVAKVPAVAKVTTVLGTGAPEVSRTVAVTLAALLALMLETTVPVTGLVNTMLIPVVPVLLESTLKPALTDKAVVAPLRVAVAEMVEAPAAVGLAPII